MLQHGTYDYILNVKYNNPKSVKISQHSMFPFCQEGGRGLCVCVCVEGDV